MNHCWTCGDGFWGPIPPVCVHPSSALVHSEGCGSFSCRGEGEGCSFKGSFQTLCLFGFPYHHSLFSTPSRMDFALKHAKICTSFPFLQFRMEASQTAKSPNKDQSWKRVIFRKLKMRCLWLNAVFFLLPSHKQACSEELWCSHRALISAAAFNTTSDR